MNSFLNENNPLTTRQINSLTSLIGKANTFNMDNIKISLYSSHNCYIDINYHPTFHKSKGRVFDFLQFQGQVSQEKSGTNFTEASFPPVKNSYRIRVVAEKYYYLNLLNLGECCSITFTQIDNLQNGTQPATARKQYLYMKTLLNNNNSLIYGSDTYNNSQVIID